MHLRSDSVDPQR